MEILKKLLAEAEAIDIAKLEAPDSEVTDDCTVVGEATTEIKQLLGLRNKLLDDVNCLHERHAAICPPTSEQQEEHDQIKVDLLYLNRKYQLVNDLLWYCVREQFPETKDKDVVSLHKGWKVSWNDEKGSGLLSIGGIGILDILAMSR